MFIVVLVIVAAVLIFALMRALSGPRQYNSPPPMPTYIDQGPVYIQEPSPMADIATFVAAEVATEVVADAVFGAFDSGPMDDGGFDQGFGDGF